MTAHRRRGLTLTELLVIIVISGVVVSLVLPALVVTRGGGRRLQCASNMRQVGLGLIQYLNTANAFPNAGTFGERPEALPGPGRDSFDPRESIIHQSLNDPARFPPDAEPRWNGSTQVGPLHSWVVSILPYVDELTIANSIHRERVYTDDTRDNGGVSNRQLFQNHISLLVCPEDDTVQRGRGNLSYVVNGGFSRWPGATAWNEVRGRFEGVFPPGLQGSANGVNADYGAPMDWGAPMARRTGLMFLGTAQGDTPWDVQTTLASMTDGASTTLLLTENLHAGYVKGRNPYSGGAEINWAAPLANSVMFFGSDDVCGGPGHAFPGNGRCLEDQGLASMQSARGIVSGPSWADANRPGAFEGINGAIKSANVPEGGSPYPASRHGGGVYAVFCDGSTQFISEAIDGAVWARLITPSGSQGPTDVETGPDLERFRLAPIRSLDDVEFFKFQSGPSRPRSRSGPANMAPLVPVLVVAISISLGILWHLIRRRGHQGPPPPSLYDPWLDG